MIGVGSRIQPGKHRGKGGREWRKKKGGREEDENRWRGRERIGRLLARFAKIYVLGIFRMNAPGVRNSSYTLERVTTMLKTLFRVAPRRLVSSLRFSEFSPPTSFPLPTPPLCSQCFPYATMA